MSLCAETTAAGTPCRSHAMAGSDRCAAHAGRVGRHTDLTDELSDRLVGMLRTGNYLDVALKACGLPRRTFRDWIERGKSDAEPDLPFAEFRRRIEAARAEGEVRNVAEIATAARENWQAAAWLLERQFPERWARVSVRYREEGPPQAEPAADHVAADDPFTEADELAERRRTRAVG